MITFISSRFIYYCIIVLLLALLPLLFSHKGEIELLINQHHNQGFDLFFKYITIFGDGVFLAILLLIVLFINYHYSIIAAFSIIIQGIVVTIFKRGIYHGLPRPKEFFSDNVSLHFVDGVNVHSYNTFPSGHTVSIFALVALIAIFLKVENKNWSILLILFALLVGFSRVYLLQHFVIDVYAGMMIGVSSVMFGLGLVELIFKKAHQEKFKTNSLLNLFGLKKS